MARIEKKLEQLRLQHQIAKILWKDNGVSTHFDYHVNIMSDDETIKLNVLTYNERHDEYMLLHTTNGSSSLDCLEKMRACLKSNRVTEVMYSYTISWSKIGDAEKHTSYFRATSEEAAKQKFLHEKNPDNYEFTVEQNPLS